MRPYSRLACHQVLDGDGGGPGLSIFIANVLMSNRQADRLLELIREKTPDVLIAVETDPWWVDHLRTLAVDYPHAVEIPKENTYGMVLRSRLPLIDPSVEYLVNDDIPSVHTRVRIAGGTMIALHAVHPKPPFPDEEAKTTDRDAQILLVGKRIAKNDDPCVVAGDLNDVAWSQTT